MNNVNSSDALIPFIKMQLGLIHWLGVCVCVIKEFCAINFLNEFIKEYHYEDIHLTGKERNRAMRKLRKIKQNDCKMTNEMNKKKRKEKKNRTKKEIK